MPLILASASPRRAELLKTNGFDFAIDPPHIDEKLKNNEPFQKHVKRLALEKGFTVAQKYTSQKNIILAADTVVVLENEILGKPKDENEAKQMLKKLSNKTHQVLTAWIVIQSPNKILKQKTESTFITFKKLSENEIVNYLALKEYQGKAGAYAIQGQAVDFVIKIKGSFSNVIGLPIEKLTPVLKTALSLR